MSKQNSLPPALADVNPLIIMGARRRLRKGALISASAIMVVLSAFIYFLVYLSVTEREIAVAEEAAKLAFLPIFIIQAILLMFIGTGSVASGIAEERAAGVIDYHRLSPMSPLSKITGYLFGLPIREYYMFALTGPFMLFSIVVGKIALVKVGQLYLVFFTSVILYHMTGMVAGMASARPRRAALFARIMVVVLYLALPYFSELGFSFLAYLTVVPTFRGLIEDELMSAADRTALAMGGLDAYKEVPFFGLTLSPTTYTLLMQSLLTVTFFVIVHRKWRHEVVHSFSKLYSIGFYAALQLLVLGSLWPLVRSGEAFGSRLFQDVGLRLGAALLAYVFICAAVCMLLIIVVTPSRQHYVKGLRRMRKLRLAKVPPQSDEATALWLTPLYGAMTAVVFLVLLAISKSSDLFFTADFGAHHYIITPVLFGSALIYVQAIRELVGARGFFMALGALWIVPGLISLLLIAAWSANLPAAYLATINPGVGLVYTLGYVMSDGATGVTRDFDGGHLAALSMLSTAISMVLAVISVSLLVRSQRALKAAEGAVPG